MPAQDGIAEQPSSAFGRCSEVAEEPHQRVAGRFARFRRLAGAGRARRYPRGLLIGRAERKRKRLAARAEAMGEADPQGVRRLSRTPRSGRRRSGGRRRPRRLRAVERHPGDEDSGVPIVDDGGFLKEGEKSVGVARRYAGSAGDTVNRRVGVFLAYSSKKGAAFVDRTLYLPKDWAEDEERRAEAGVPEEVRFANKLELAKRMLKWAFAAGVPARWVVADSFYGRSHKFRRWL